MRCTSAAEPRIALLDASHNDPTTPRNFRRDLDGNLRRFSVIDREFPDPGRFDAIVVPGSRASVHRDERWIAEIKVRVRIRGRKTRKAGVW